VVAWRLISHRSVGLVFVSPFRTKLKLEPSQQRRNEPAKTEPAETEATVGWAGSRVHYLSAGQNPCATLLAQL
jgi:hypothetical protein